MARAIRQNQQPAAVAVITAGIALSCALLPSVSAQAFAGAGNGAALAAAGFPFNFPFPNIQPLCNSGFTIDPWAPPAAINNPPGGLVTFLNGQPTFADVTLCCGTPLTFSWSQGQGTHGLWQLQQPVCPSPFANDASQGQRQLFAPAAANDASITLNTPGTYYFTSQSGDDCVNGQLVTVVVPAGLGCSGTSASSTSGGPETQTTIGQGSQATASGPVNGTSTSANFGNAAAASGPPGQQRTATGPNFSYSASGGRRLRSSVAAAAA